MTSRAPARARRSGGQQKWIEGGLKYQYGTNCIILGGAYTEPMVASYVRYGGLDHLPRVGETYTASIVVGVTGNPCPFGYGYVYTELVLPRGTQLAPGQAIQCLGVNRNGATENLSNATWRDPANPSLTGRYCPAQASSGSYGGIGFGFRPLAQGQIFELRVKVVSSVALRAGATRSRRGSRPPASTATRPRRALRSRCCRRPRSRRRCRSATRTRRTSARRRPRRAPRRRRSCAASPTPGSARATRSSASTTPRARRCCSTARTPRTACRACAARRWPPPTTCGSASSASTSIRRRPTATSSRSRSGRTAARSSRARRRCSGPGSRMRTPTASPTPATAAATCPPPRAATAARCSRRRRTATSTASPMPRTAARRSSPRSLRSTAAATPTRTACATTRMPARTWPPRRRRVARLRLPRRPGRPSHRLRTGAATRGEDRARRAGRARPAADCPSPSRARSRRRRPSSLSVTKSTARNGCGFPPSREAGRSRSPRRPAPVRRRRSCGCACAAPRPSNSGCARTAARGSACSTSGSPTGRATPEDDQVRAPQAIGMRVCHECGAANPDARDFCACGEYLRWEETGSHPEPVAQRGVADTLVRATPRGVAPVTVVLRLPDREPPRGSRSGTRSRPGGDAGAGAGAQPERDRRQLRPQDRRAAARVVVDPVRHAVSGAVRVRRHATSRRWRSNCTRRAAPRLTRGCGS